MREKGNKRRARYNTTKRLGHDYQRTKRFNQKQPQPPTK